MMIRIVFSNMQMVILLTGIVLTFTPPALPRWEMEHKESTDYALLQLLSSVLLVKLFLLNILACQLLVYF